MCLSLAFKPNFTANSQWCSTRDPPKIFCGWIISEGTVEDFSCPGHWVQIIWSPHIQGIQGLQTMFDLADWPVPDRHQTQISETLIYWHHDRHVLFLESTRGQRLPHSPKHLLERHKPSTRNQPATVRTLRRTSSCRPCCFITYIAFVKATCKLQRQVST